MQRLAQPIVEMFRYEVVIGEMGIDTANTIDLFHLSCGQFLVRIKAPTSLRIALVVAESRGCPGYIHGNDAQDRIALRSSRLPESPASGASALGPVSRLH